MWRYQIHRIIWSKVCPWHANDKKQGYINMSVFVGKPSHEILVWYFHSRLEMTRKNRESGICESPVKALITHWGRVTHTRVSKLTIIGSDNGLSPGRCQTIIWTNAGMSLIGLLGTNFRGILIKMYISSFRKMHLKMLSGNWRPFCLGLNVLRWSARRDRRLQTHTTTLDIGQALSKIW